MNVLRTAFFVCLVTGLSFLVSSCKKDKASDDPGSEAVSLTLKNTGVKPFEIAELAASKPLATEEYSATLSGLDVKLIRTEEKNALIFLVPELAEGTHTLLFDSEELPDQLNISVTAGVVVSDPKAVTDEFALSFQQDIQVLQQYLAGSKTITQTQLDELAAMNTTFETEMNKLGSDDKRALAIFIETNGLNEKKLEFEAFTDSFYTGKKGNPSDAAAELHRLSNRLSVAVVAMGFTVSTAVISSRLLHVPWGPAALLASGVALKLEWDYVKNLLERIGELKGIAEEIDPSFKKADPEFTIIKGEPYEINPTIRFRTLNSGDRTSSNSFLNGLVKNIDKGRGYLVEIVAFFDKVKSYFTGTVSGLSAPSDLPAQSQSSFYTVNAAHWKVAEVSGGVSLSLSVQNDMLRLTADGPESKDFTFRLSYERPDAGIAISRIVTAEYKAEFVCATGATLEWSGYEYEVVKVGNQCWFAENLRVEAGTHVTSASVWESSQSPAWCHYNNDPLNENTHGKMYNWYAASSGVLCPNGWHVATKNEMINLVNTFGGESVAGSKLKSVNGFSSPNTADNSSGFSATGTGFRDSDDGGFTQLGIYGAVWTATDGTDPELAWSINFQNNYAQAYVMETPKGMGVACRCVQD